MPGQDGVDKAIWKNGLFGGQHSDEAQYKQRSDDRIVANVVMTAVFLPFGALMSIFDNHEPTEIRSKAAFVQLQDERRQREKAANIGKDGTVSKKKQVHAVKATEIDQDGIKSNFVQGFQSKRSKDIIFVSPEMRTFYEALTDESIRSDDELDTKFFERVKGVRSKVQAVIQNIQQQMQQEQQREEEQEMERLIDAHANAQQSTQPPVLSKVQPSNRTSLFILARKLLIVKLAYLEPSPLTESDIMQIVSALETAKDSRFWHDLAVELWVDCIADYVQSHSKSEVLALFGDATACRVDQWVSRVGVGPSFLETCSELFDDEFAEGQQTAISELQLTPTLLVLFVFRHYLASVPAHQRLSFLEVSRVVSLLVSLKSPGSVTRTLLRLPAVKWEAVLATQLLRETLQPLEESPDVVDETILHLDSIASQFGTRAKESFREHIITSRPNGLSEINATLRKIARREWTLNQDTMETLTRVSAAYWKTLDLSMELQTTARSSDQLISMIEEDPNNSDFLDCDFVMLHKLVERINNSTRFASFKRKKDVTKYIAQHRTDVEELLNRDNPDTILRSEKFQILMALIVRAVYLEFSFSPRSTQLLAVLMTLIKTRDSLLEVHTGEGKTLIVMMLAVLKSLAGKAVDVVTSSPVLAKRDAEESESFFEMFGLKVGHNCDSDTKARQDAYKQDIVYGDAAAFERDMLMDRFYHSNVRGARHYGDAIVDEVDSMLLDKGDHMLYLSQSIPGIEYLEGLYVTIWFAAQSVSFNMPNDEAVEKVRTFVEQQIETGDVQIPVAFEEFVADRLDLWIQSAFLARGGLGVNDSYTVGGTQEEVVTMDKSTGVRLSDCHLSEGIHQFLQLKHLRRFSPETLKSIFVSNKSFFSYYQSLSGLSGTLGSENEKTMLALEYNLDVAYIPTNKDKLYTQESPILAEDLDVHLAEVIKDVRNKHAQHRPVLIINENVAAAKKLSKGLEKNGIFPTLYFFDGDFIPSTLTRTDVIVSTNLAGRGTDLKIPPNIAKSGGLHVILTYCPSNLRIERQAFGRAARKGQPGSGRFILVDRIAGAAEPDLHSRDIFVLEKQFERNQSEAVRLRRLREYGLDQIKLEEELLALFGAEVLDSIEIEEDGIRAIVVDNALSEFSLWLDKQRFRVKACKTANAAAVLKEELREYIQLLNSKGRFDSANFHNPLFNLRLAKHHLKEEAYGEAICEFRRAIARDTEFAEFSHYYLAAALINQDSDNYRDAIRHFQQAEQLIRKRLQAFATLPQVVKKTKEFQLKAGEGTGSDLYSVQIQHKMTIYNAILSSILVAAGTRPFDAGALTTTCINDEQKVKLVEKMKKNRTLLGPVQLIEEFDFSESNIASKLMCPELTSSRKAEIAKVVLRNRHNLKPQLFEDLLGNADELFERLASKGIVSAEEDQEFLLSEHLFTPLPRAIVDDSLQKGDRVVLGSRQFVVNSVKRHEDDGVVEIAMFEIRKRVGGLDKDAQILLYRNQEPHFYWKIGEKKGKQVKGEHPTFTVFHVNRADVFRHAKMRLVSSTSQTKKGGGHNFTGKAAQLAGDTIGIDCFADKRITIELGVHTQTGEYGIHNISCSGGESTTPSKGIQDVSIKLTDKFRVTNDAADAIAAYFSDPTFKENYPPLDAVSDLLLASQGRVISKADVMMHNRQQCAEKFVAQLCHFGIAHSEYVQDVDEKVAKREFETMGMSAHEAKELAEDFAKAVEKLVGKVITAFEKQSDSGTMIATFKKVRDDLQDSYSYSMHRDLEAMSSLGLDSVVRIENKPFWWGPLVVFLLGLAQIVLGAVLTILGAPNLGMAFISEGIGDIQYAIEAQISGNFSWSDYLTYKRESLAISMLTCGIAAGINAGVKVATGGIKAAMKIVIEKVSETILTTIAMAGIDKILDTIFDAVVNTMVGQAKGKMSIAFGGLQSKLETLYQKTCSQSGVRRVMDKIRDQYFNGPTVFEQVERRCHQVVGMIATTISNAVAVRKNHGAGFKALAAVGETIQKALKVTKYASSIAKACTEMQRFAMHAEQIVNEANRNAVKSNANAEAESDAFIGKEVSQWEQMVVHKMISYLRNGILKPEIQKSLNTYLSQVSKEMLSGLTSKLSEKDGYEASLRQARVHNLCELMQPDALFVGKDIKSVMDTLQDKPGALNEIKPNDEAMVSNTEGYSVKDIREMFTDAQFFEHKGRLLFVPSEVYKAPPVNAKPSVSPQQLYDDKLARLRKKYPKVDDEELKKKAEEYAQKAHKQLKAQNLKAMENTQDVIKHPELKAKVASVDDPNSDTVSSETARVTYPESDGSLHEMTDSLESQAIAFVNLLDAKEKGDPAAIFAIEALAEKGIHIGTKPKVIVHREEHNGEVKEARQEAPCLQVGGNVYVSADSDAAATYLMSLATGNVGPMLATTEGGVDTTAVTATLNELDACIPQQFRAPDPETGAGSSPAIGVVIGDDFVPAPQGRLPGVFESNFVGHMAESGASFPIAVEDPNTGLPRVVSYDPEDVAHAFQGFRSFWSGSGKGHFSPGRAASPVTTGSQDVANPRSATAGKSDTVVKAMLCQAIYEALPSGSFEGANSKERLTGVFHNSKVREIIGSDWTVAASSHDAAVFVNTKTKEAVLTCRGSALWLRDWAANNVHGYLGVYDGRVETTIETMGPLLRELQETQGFTISATGHSLGGSVASAVAAKLEIPVVTFNAPQLGHKNNKYTADRIANTERGNVQHYYHEYDVISCLDSDKKVERSWNRIKNINTDLLAPFNAHGMDATLHSLTGGKWNGYTPPNPDLDKVKREQMLGFMFQHM